MAEGLQKWTPGFQRVAFGVPGGSGGVGPKAVLNDFEGPPLEAVERPREPFGAARPF